MRVELTGVAKGRDHATLPPTSLRFATGELSLALAETERRPTVLSLIAAGRMRPDSGTVIIDGRDSPADLRRRVALIDTPEVCDPADDVRVTGVTAEELMFAGRPWHLVAVMRMLRELGLESYARTTMANLPPDVRIRLLTELAILRDGVAGLVVTSPDRHGGDPHGWWRIGRDLAERDYAVLMIAGTAAATALGVAEAGEALAAPGRESARPEGSKQ